MLRILANDHDAALALDDLALFADRLNGRSHFHDNSSYSVSGRAAGLVSSLSAR